MNIALVHDVKKVGEEHTFGAVPYYRMQKPNEVLKRLYPEFDFVTTNSIDYLTPDILKQTDLILVTRIVKDIDKLNSYGVPWGLDVDDFWELPDDHILARSYKENNTPEKIVKSIQAAHFVITTTEILAEKVRPYNSNVHIIENGIDTDDQAWVPNKVKSNRVRFGFTQGTTHIPDIELISDSVVKSFDDRRFTEHGQIVLCGFNAMLNEPSIYVGYERLLTNNLLALRHSPEYVKRLIKLVWVNGNSYPYKRVKAVDTKHFGYIHNELDIIVAPLKQSDFNSCKSNIKMLEAGFMDCAVMVHNVSPYKELMTKDNSFDLSEKSFYDWQKYIINNHSILEERKQALKESVQPFEMKRLTEKRRNLYKSIK